MNMRYKHIKTYGMSITLFMTQVLLLSTYIKVGSQGEEIAQWINYLLWKR